MNTSVTLNLAEVEQLLPGIEQVIAEHRKDRRFFWRALAGGNPVDRDVVVREIDKSIRSAESVRAKLQAAEKALVTAKEMEDGKQG